MSACLWKVICDTWLNSFYAIFLILNGAQWRLFSGDDEDNAAAAAAADDDDDDFGHKKDIMRIFLGKYLAFFAIICRIFGL